MQGDERKGVFTALFQRPPQRVNGVRLVSFDPAKRKDQERRSRARADHRRWYVRNRAIAIIRAVEWNRSHPERRRAIESAYQARNVEKYRRAKRDYMRRQREFNPERVKAWARAKAA